MQPLRVGVVGVGNISGAYFHCLKESPDARIVAVADLDADRARAKADENGVALALTPDELLAHPEVDVVLNLTIPAAHIPVARQAVANGKHVYGEKPLSVDRNGGLELLAEADEKGVLVGCAPDTVLGAGIQRARAAVDAGDIGVPLGAQGFMLCPGHESWHPSPEFYYQRGGGPMLDMGPYYVSALFQLLGPIRRVTGSVKRTHPTRTITSQPKAGTVVDVEVNTHQTGIFDFADGAIAHLTTSFDVYHGNFGNIVIHGTEGSLRVPDPNGFDGDVMVRHRNDSEWRLLDPIVPAHVNGRGLGLIDMVRAIREGRPHRASGAIAYHVLDAMLAVEEASAEGRHLELTSGVARPAPLGADF